MTSPLERATDLPAVDTAWKLLERSFPPSELVDRAAFEASILDGSKVLWTDAQGVVLAVTCDLGLPGQQVLLEYLAVEPERRSAGFGSLALRSLTHQWDGPIVFEMDPPSAEHADTMRRLAFYDRFGATRIAHSDGYCMPDLAGDGLVPMWLMDLIPSRSPSRLSVGEVVTLTEAIWRASYGCPDGDPRLHQVVTRIRTRARGE